MKLAIVDGIIKAAFAASNGTVITVIKPMPKRTALVIPKISHVTQALVSRHDE